ncbi:hypothetical protein KC354_g1763 [Hortaea werneckii]|nr:hypothetical protein KC354_g1763 [Hortaea werneckii]
MRTTRARARVEGIPLATEEEMAAAVKARRRKNPRRQQPVQRPAEDAKGNDQARPETQTGDGMHRNQLEATGDQGKTTEGEDGHFSSRSGSRDSNQDDERELRRQEPDAQNKRTEGEGEGSQPSSRKRSREPEQDDEEECEGPDAQKGRMEEGGEQSRTPEEERRPPCEVLAERLAAWRQVARAEAQADFTPLQEGHELFQETAFLAIASVTEAIAAAGGPAFALIDPVLGGIPSSAQRVLRPRHTVLFPAHRGRGYGGGGGHLYLYIIRGMESEGAQSGNATRFQVEAHDSFGPTRNATLQARLFEAVRLRLENGGWTGHGFGDPENDALFANRIVAGEGVADQRAGWNCGFHTVLNAWAHALNLQTVAAGVRLGGQFNAVSVEMVNLAMQGFMDSATIEAFFLCHGYVAADQRVPLNRRFERTRPFRRLEELQQFLAERRLEEDLQRRRVPGPENGDDGYIPHLNEALNVMRLYGLEPADLTSMGIDEFLLEYRLARDRRIVDDLFANAERQPNPGLNEERAIDTAIEASLMNGIGSSQANRSPSDRPGQTANQTRPSSERAGSGAPQPNTQENSNGTIQPRRDLESDERATDDAENDGRPHRNPSASSERERQHRRRQFAWEGVALAMADLSALNDAALERLRGMLAIGIQDVASERARRAEQASDQPAASQGASQRHQRASRPGTPFPDNQSDSADSNLDATLAHLSQREGWASRLEGEHRFRRRSQGPDDSPLASRRRSHAPGQARSYRYPEGRRRSGVGRRAARAARNHHPLRGAAPAGGWPAPESVLQDEWWQVWEPREPEEWMVWLRRELDWARSRKPPRRRTDGSRAHPAEGDPLLRREYMETSSPE